MPIARLLRTPTGDVSLDPAFIPPLLELAASHALVGTARRVLERVAAKARPLAGSRRQRNQGLADFSITDVASFWLLYTLNTHLPSLRHLAEVRGGHPEPLWDAMVALAGALTTFAPVAAAAAGLRPPAARRRASRSSRRGCSSCSRRRCRRRRSRSRCARSRRRSRRPRSTRRSWLRAPQWYLAVSAPVRQAELVARVVHGCKAGSADVVDTLIRQALPGMELVHVPQPPSAVPVKLDFLYFAVGRTGPAWDAVTRARNLAVYVPAELPGARLELIVVLQ